MANANHKEDEKAGVIPSASLSEPQRASVSLSEPQQASESKQVKVIRIFHLRGPF